MLLNLVLLPWMEERQIKEVDYGTFMTMTEEKNIGRVDIESNQIIFTDKDETQVYKTGLMNDTGLTERLYTLCILSWAYLRIAPSEGDGHF